MKEYKEAIGCFTTMAHEQEQFMENYNNAPADKQEWWQEMVNDIDSRMRGVCEAIGAIYCRTPLQVWSDIRHAAGIGEGA